jgi:alpha-L-rhamnosidase
MLLNPRKLRTENQVHPLGICVRNPLFSWSLTDAGERGVRHAAWQIELVDATGTKVWDSGMMSGDELSYECQGNVVRSFSCYQWRVRCWSADGTCGADSPWARFETAALDAADLKASWITHPAPASHYEGSWESGVPNEKSANEKSIHFLGIYCSCVFALKGRRITRARAFATGVGVYTLYMNGKQVNDDVLSPATTDFRKRVLYSVYDITPHLLYGRDEQVVTLALGNGRHIALYGFGKPRGWLQILLEVEDGSVEWVCSGRGWVAGDGPVRENSIFNGERCDARMRVPSCAEDLSGLVPAEIIAGYPLEAAQIPPIRVEKEIEPVRMWRAHDCFLYDFGQNFSGAVRLRLSVPRGTELRLSFAELIHADGTLNPASNRAARCSDSYIARGEPGETWQPTTTYHGFRYLSMEGYPGVPASDAVTGLFFHTEVEREGDFFCSLPLFNDIHRAILWGQLSNLMGIPTDSPQRDERHGWLGDAMLSSEECILNFGTVAFWEKFLQDIVDTQLPDGSITDVAPKFWMSKPADPAWGSALISIAWSLYRFKGDRRILEKHYSAFSAYIEYLAAAAEGFLIENLGTFGDWCAPGMVFPRKTGLVFTSSWYFQHDCGLLADIAAVLEKPADVSRYRALQEKTGAAMNARFRKEKWYESLPVSRWDFPDQTSQALALCSPLVQGEERKTVAAALDWLVTADSGDHVGTGIHGTRYLLEALTNSGFAEKAFTIASQETYPGWGYMLREGATTLWERWEKIESSGMNSHNHIMLGSIDLWLYGAVAGIRIDGCRQIRFSPGILLKIDHACARLEVPAGTASISWLRRGEGIDLELRIPPGCSGTLCLPAGFELAELHTSPSHGTHERLPAPARDIVEIDSGWYTARLGKRGT